MKKTHIIFTLILLAVLHITAYAESSISCTSSVLGQNAVISGQIIGANKSHQVTVLVGNISDLSSCNTDDIVYIDQIESDANGNFTFEFMIPNRFTPGEYLYTIGSDAGCPKYTGRIVYPATTYTEEREFCNADITLDVVNYVPTLSGTLNCTNGKAMSLQIENITDSTVIANDEMTSENGVYNISYTLPNLLTARDYTVTIVCSNEDTTLVEMSVEIDSSIITVSVNGNIQTSENVKLDARVQSNHSELIDESAIVTGTKNISTTLPNILSNMSFHVTATGYETVTITPSESEVLASSRHTVLGQANDKYIINVSAFNITNIDEKSFVLKYDSDLISLNNITDRYSNMGINIISHTPGEIVFVLNDALATYQTIRNGIVGIFECTLLSTLQNGTDIVIEIAE